MSRVSEHLQWNIRLAKLLQRTTRSPYSHPGWILNAGEAKAASVAYEAGWKPKDFARIIINRDLLDRASKAGQ